MVDLFEQYETLHQAVNDAIERFGEAEDYIQCEAFLAELKPLGYTFEYGLDAQPFGLRKVSITNSRVARRFLPLNSVGAVLDIDEKVVMPQGDTNNQFMQTPLDECIENNEWTESLSLCDRHKMYRTLQIAELKAN